MPGILIHQTFQFGAYRSEERERANERQTYTQAHTHIGIQRGRERAQYNVEGGGGGVTVEEPVRALAYASKRSF